MAFRLSSDIRYLCGFNASNVTLNPYVYLTKAKLPENKEVSDTVRDLMKR